MEQRRSRRMVLLVAALVAIAASCAPMPPGDLPPGDPADGLRVMTYNLLGAQADGAVFSEHAGWAARIDQLRPDVLVVQEAQSEDVAALRGLTTEDYTLAAYQWWACDRKGNPEGVAILVRSDITVANGGGTNIGGSCSDPTVRRVLVWADLQLPGGPLRIYGTHLTSGDGPAAGSRDQSDPPDPRADRRGRSDGQRPLAPGRRHELHAGLHRPRPDADRRRQVGRTGQHARHLRRAATRGGRPGHLSHLCGCRPGRADVPVGEPRGRPRLRLHLGLGQGLEPVGLRRAVAVHVVADPGGDERDEPDRHGAAPRGRSDRA